MTFSVIFYKTRDMKTNMWLADKVVSAGGDIIREYRCHWKYFLSFVLHNTNDRSKINVSYYTNVPMDPTVMR